MNKLLTILACLFFVGLLQAQEIKREQISLVTKKTATWCPTCGGQAWDSFRDMISENSSRALPIAAHFSSASELYSSTAEAIVENFESSPGQPVFYFNRARLSGRGASTVADVRNRVNEAAEQTPLVGLGVEAGFENGQLTVAYAMEFLEATSGDFQVGFYPIRKTVVATQSTRGNDAEHKQIMGDELLGMDFGIPSSSGDIPEGRMVSQRFVINADYASEVENGNLDVAVIVWKKISDNDYEYVNAGVANVVMGSLSSIETLDNSVSELKVMPNQDGSTLLELDAKVQLKNTQLSIFSIDGRLLDRPYMGELSAGKHQFSFSGADGIYVANLLVNGKQITKKFVVQ